MGYPASEELEVNTVHPKTILAVLLLLAPYAYGQASSESAQANQIQQNPAPASQTAPPAAAQGKHGRSAKGDIGSGSGDIGKGAGEGAGSLAKGTGAGAVDLATLHPVNAAGAVGKGGAVAGKDVGVGAAKGTGKIAKGTGKAIKKIF